LCSMGLLLTDLKAYFSAGRMMAFTSQELSKLATDFADLERQATQWFDREGIALANRSTARSVDLRYHGQAYELTIDCPDGPITDALLAEVKLRFEAAHTQMYGYASPNEPINVIALRLEATGRVPKARLVSQPPATAPVADAIIGERKVWMPEAHDFVPCQLYDRTKLGPGHVVLGPAIIEQMDSTTLVLPGQTATVDSYLNLLLEETE
jgi:N-methylhydantoinase A